MSKKQDDIYIGFTPREIKLLTEILSFNQTCAPGSYWERCGICDECEFTEVLNEVREKIKVYENVK